MPEREDEVIVGLPFMEVGLVWKYQGLEEHFLVESHFSRTLGERAVMLVVRERPDPSLKALSARLHVTLPFAFDRAEELIEFMWRNYRGVLEKLGSAKPRDDVPRPRVGVTGLARMLFGRGLHGFPEYRLGEFEKLRILADLYASSLFPGGERPLVAAELKVVVPFAYSAKRKAFRYPLGRRSRLRYSASILTELVRRGEIPEPV